MRRVALAPRSAFPTYRREVGDKPLPFPLPPPLVFARPVALHALDEVAQIVVAVARDVLQVGRREVLNIRRAQALAALHGLADILHGGEGAALRLDLLHAIDGRGVGRGSAVAAAQKPADKIDEAFGGSGDGIDHGKAALAARPHGIDDARKLRVGVSAPLLLIGLTLRGALRRALAPEGGASFLPDFLIGGAVVRDLLADITKPRNVPVACGQNGFDAL